MTGVDWTEMRQQSSFGTPAASLSKWACRYGLTNMAIFLIVLLLKKYVTHHVELNLGPGSGDANHRNGERNWVFCYEMMEYTINTVYKSTQSESRHRSGS
jgi:hypothetical protein